VGVDGVVGACVVGVGGERGCGYGIMEVRILPKARS
jgi:hypothetical protein